MVKKPFTIAGNGEFPILGLTYTLHMTIDQGCIFMREKENLIRYNELNKCTKNFGDCIFCTARSYKYRLNISVIIIIDSVGVEPTKNSKTMVFGKIEKITAKTFKSKNESLTFMNKVITDKS